MELVKSTAAILAAMAITAWARGHLAALVPLFTVLGIAAVIGLAIWLICSLFPEDETNHNRSKRRRL